MQAVGRCQSAELHILPYPTGLTQLNSGSQDTTTRGGFDAVTHNPNQDTDLSCHAHFHFLLYHNYDHTPTLQPDRRTDVMSVA